MAARARSSGRRNEAASSEPSIYSVRTVERIIGHSLHGQSKAEEAESERARRRPACLPSLVGSSQTRFKWSPFWA